MQKKSHLATANALFRSAQYNLALKEYQQFITDRPELAKFIQANIRLSESRLSRPTKTTCTQNERPLVSVIIPVHNVQNYIRQCLDSVLSQTLQNIEVIVVDDGSTDESPKILAEYSRTDERVIYIRNSTASGNSGTPRNQALARATGEYVAFVDSDDWIDPGMLAALHNEATLSGSDIVTSGGFYRENSDGESELVNVSNHTFNPEIDKRETLFLGHHFTIVWYRIYRLDFIRRERIQFGETTTSADVPFAIKSLLFANKVTDVSEVYYHYRFDRPDSTIFRRKGRGAFELFRSYSLLFESLAQKSRATAYFPFVVLKALGDYQYNLRFLADELREEFNATMQAFVFKYGRSISEHPAFNKYWRSVLVSLLESKGQRSLEEHLNQGSKAAPAVSIIIPAHNVENYIHRSLTSVLKQSLTDIEVIVINDGSSDHTLSLIESIAAQDPRVVLISANRASGNPGTPRNMGICKARGEFIGFVDADDWVEQDMFEKLLHSARSTHSDIASASGFYRHEQNVVKEFKIGYKNIEPNARNNKEAFTSGFFSNIWNRIYKKELVKSNNIYFPRIYLAEDFCFSAVCHALATRTITAEGAYYHYDYSRPNSTTDLRTGTKGFEIIKDFQAMMNYFQSFGLYEKLAAEIIKKKINSLWYTYERLQPSLQPAFLDQCRELLIPLRQKFESSVFSKDDLKKFGLHH